MSQPGRLARSLRHAILAVGFLTLLLPISEAWSQGVGSITGVIRNQETGRRSITRTSY